VVTDRPVVAHSMVEWLPPTETWIYGQIANMRAFAPIVLADRLSEPCEFHWEPLVVASPWERQVLRVSAKVGLRPIPRSHRLALARYRPAILHSHFGYRGWWDIRLRRVCGAKHVVTFYGYDLSLLPRLEPVWRERYIELFGDADLVLCEGPFMARTLGALGCPREKINVQPLGVDVDRIKYRERVPSSKVRILIAGSFREKKGIPIALEAVARAQAEAGNLEVTVIGDAPGQDRESAEKRAILDVVRRRELEPIVTLLGYQPHERLLDEAYRHDVFLSPSVTASDGDTEGGAPVAIIDMAATGLPVVSSRHCDIPEVVKDGVTGLLAEERDVEGLAERLIMLARDAELRRIMGKAGRRHVEENYDVRRLVARLEDAYKRVLIASAPKPSVSAR
jgi:colanic acid/amylovoran biosynthesis glycosyltransferase